MSTVVAIHEVNKQTAVSEQRLGKHVPAERTRMQQYKNDVFDVVRAEEL
jgi:hypothetical protein